MLVVVMVPPAAAAIVVAVVVRVVVAVVVVAAVIVVAAVVVVAVLTPDHSLSPRCPCPPCRKCVRYGSSSKKPCTSIVGSRPSPPYSVGRTDTSMTWYTLIKGRERAQSEWAG